MRDRLRTAWPWHTDIIFTTFILTLSLGIMGYYLGQPLIGSLAWLSAIISVWGLIYVLMYVMVQRRLRKKRAQLEQYKNGVTETIVGYAKMHIPAVMLLESDKVTFLPIVGPKLEIPFHKITHIRGAEQLFGKRFIFKNVIMLSLNDGNQAGFALPHVQASHCYNQIEQALNTLD